MLAARRLAFVLGLVAAVATASTASAREPGTVDLDVVSADVRDVIRLLADVGHVNVVVADEVGGRVTMRLKNVHWRDAFDAVLAVRGLAAEQRGNILVVRAR